MKFCVIGLGRFGFQVAVSLAENGMEVLAVDKNESIIASIRDHVTQAICIEIIDEDSLQTIGIEEIDTVIVAMGESFAQSILITALLKKRLSIPHVITRAISEIHRDILMLTGANKTVLLEKDMALRLADNLSFAFKDLVRITKNFSISQIAAPRPFVGHALKRLDLHRDYRVQCIAIRKEDDTVTLADPDYVIEENDTLIFSGETKNLMALTKM